MEIRFNDKKRTIYLGSDANCFVVFDGYATGGGKEKQKINPSYYGSISQALTEILNRTIKGSKATTIEQLLKEIQDLKLRIVHTYAINSKTLGEKANA